MKHAIDWKVFAVLLGASLVSVICVFPYVLSLQGKILDKMGLSIPVIFAAQFAQSIVLFSIVIFFGLMLTKKVGFHLPLIDAIIKSGEPYVIFRNIFAKSVLLGIAAATSIYVVDIIFTLLGAAITTHQNTAPVWQKLLASFYGGITEEIIMRLFFMTFFTWVSMKILRQKVPTKAGIWVAIILSSVIFGLGHLPVTASLTQLTPLIVARAIVLNGIGGIVFGWLFWKKGLESAIIAHFTADIFLLTLLPMLSG